MFCASAGTKRIELALEAPSELVISSNRSNLALALRNLISNAIKFSYPDSSIGVIVSSTPDGADISIRDKGIGIPADKQESLFNIGNGFRRQGTDGEPSNGFGLAVTRTLLESCGSSLKLESSEGEGSTFTIQVKNRDENA